MLLDDSLTQTLIKKLDQKWIEAMVERLVHDGLLEHKGNKLTPSRMMTFVHPGEK